MRETLAGPAPDEPGTEGFALEVMGRLPALLADIAKLPIEGERRQEHKQQQQTGKQRAQREDAVRAYEFAKSSLPEVSRQPTRPRKTPEMLAHKYALIWPFRQQRGAAGARWAHNPQDE